MDLVEVRAVLVQDLLYLILLPRVELSTLPSGGSSVPEAAPKGAPAPAEWTGWADAAAESNWRGRTSPIPGAG
jgi:hypothetical protein